jgi:hypothetical protein
VTAIPGTLTGKTLEALVERTLLRKPLDNVASRDALMDASALDALVEVVTHARINRLGVNPLQDRLLSLPVDSTGE